MCNFKLLKLFCELALNWETALNDGYELLI